METQRNVETQEHEGDLEIRQGTQTSYEKWREEETQKCLKSRMSQVGRGPEIICQRHTETAKAKNRKENGNKIDNNNI